MHTRYLTLTHTHTRAGVYLSQREHALQSYALNCTPERHVAHIQTHPKHILACSSQREHVLRVICTYCTPKRHEAHIQIHSKHMAACASPSNTPHPNHIPLRPILHTNIHIYPTDHTPSWAYILLICIYCTLACIYLTLTYTQTHNEIYLVLLT